MANGPTAADRLPQLPLQSTKVDRSILDRKGNRRRDPLDRFLHEYRFAGARGSSPHSINLFGVGVRAADDPQQHSISVGPGNLECSWQRVHVEEHALTSASTHVSGGILI